jgi:hypothetical protein
MDRSGCAFSSRGRTHSPINETKLTVLTTLDALDRPATGSELWEEWDEEEWGEAKSPSIIDYHLCTLVQMKVLKLVIGPELRFCRLDHDIPLENQ